MLRIAKPLGLPLDRDRTAERRKSSAPSAESQRAPWVGVKDSQLPRRSMIPTSAASLATRESYPSAEEIVSELSRSSSQGRSKPVNKMLRGRERGVDATLPPTQDEKAPSLRNFARKKKEDVAVGTKKTTTAVVAKKKKEEEEDGKRSKCLRSPKSVGAVLAANRGRGGRTGPAVEQSLRARSPFSAGGRELFSPTIGERDKGLALDLFKAFYRRDPSANASVDSAELLRLQNWCRSEGLDEDVLPLLSAGGVSKLSVLELLTQNDLQSLGLDEERAAELMQRVRRLTVRTLSMSEKAMGLGLGTDAAQDFSPAPAPTQPSSSTSDHPPPEFSTTSAAPNPVSRVQHGHADPSRSRSRSRSHSPFAAGIVRPPVVREPAKVFVRYPPSPHNPALAPAPAPVPVAISPVTRDNGNEGAGGTPLQRLLAQSLLKKKREAALLSESLSLSPQPLVTTTAAVAVAVTAENEDEGNDKIRIGEQSGERNEEKAEEGAEEEKSQTFTREALFPPKPAAQREVAVVQRTTLLEGLRLAFDEGSGEMFMSAWRQALAGMPGETRLEFLLLLYFASWALRVDSPSTGTRLSALRDFLQRDAGVAREALAGLGGQLASLSSPPPQRPWPQSSDEAKSDALFCAVAASFPAFSEEVRRRFAEYLEHAGLAAAEMCTSLKISSSVPSGAGFTRPTSLPAPARWGAHGPALSGSGYGGYHHQHFSGVRRAASVSPSQSPMSSPSSTSSASPTHRSRSPSSGPVASASFPYRTLSPQAAALALQLAAYQRGCRYELAQAAGSNSSEKSKSHHRPSMRRRTLSASPSSPSPSPEVSTPPLDSSSDLSRMSDHDSRDLLLLSRSAAGDSEDFKM